MITDSRETTEREDPPPGPGRDRAPTVGLEMTDQCPVIGGRGREEKHLLVEKDQIRETKLNQKRGIFVRSTAG